MYVLNVLSNVFDIILHVIGRENTHTGGDMLCVALNGPLLLIPAADMSESEMCCNQILLSATAISPSE